MNILSTILTLPRFFPCNQLKGKFVILKMLSIPVVANVVPASVKQVQLKLEYNFYCMKQMIDCRS
jgi:hypothetical protein